MVPKPDTDRFELSELRGDVAGADIEALARITAVTREDEPMWAIMIANATKEDEERWTAKFYRDGALKSRDRKIFIIREKATGCAIFQAPSISLLMVCSVIRAFTVLQYPVTKTLAEQEAAKRSMEEGIASLPAGANMEYAKFIFNEITPRSKKYGYDPQKHFRRFMFSHHPEACNCAAISHMKTSILAHS